MPLKRIMINMCNMIKCPNCKKDYSETDWQKSYGYCPGCGYAHKISDFERNSIKRRLLADFANAGFNKVIKDAGSKEVETDWMLKKEFITASLENNNLFKFIVKHFGEDAAYRIAAKYRLETHSYKDFYGAAIFYQYDKEKKCHAFKVMQYDEDTGKRIKGSSDNEENKEEAKNEKDLLYQKPLMGAGNYCLFGRHLLTEQEKDKKICIVESEKTAIIASIAYPEAIWMATGSCYYLTEEKIDFSTENLYLFPDSDVNKESNGNWFSMVRHCAWLNRARVSNFMGNYSKANKKTTDFDIADYIIENYNPKVTNNNLESLNEIIK